MGLPRDTTKVGSNRMEEGMEVSLSRLAKTTQMVKVRVLKGDLTTRSQDTMITIREVATNIIRRTMGIGAILTTTEATVATTLRCLMSLPMLVMEVAKPRSSLLAEHQGPTKLAASLNIRRTRVKQRPSNLSKIAPKISLRNRVQPLNPSLRAKQQG